MCLTSPINKYKKIHTYLVCVAVVVAYMIPGCNKEKGWSKTWKGWK